VDKLKILMLNYEFPPIGGGAANAHLALLKQFCDFHNLKIDVLTSAPKPSFVHEQFSDNINIYKVGLHKKNLHYWRKIEVIEWLFKARPYYRRMLRENDYDLVHAFFAFPTGWLCYKTADKIPYIISLRGSDVPGYNIRLGLDYKLLAGLFRKIWSSAAMIVANSKGLQQLAKKFMPDLNISVIPNGVDMNRFHPKQNHKFDKRLKLLSVCRLISRKRIDLLIEAVSKSVESGLDTELNIAGQGNLMQQLKELANKLGVANRVNFMGRITSEQIPQVYRDNDIFVMSSAHEGMSNAMLEAMASGLPIVTTRCEGVEELIGNNGIILEDADAQKFADSIKHIKQNREKYKNMSLAARKKTEKFNWKSVAEQYYKFYRNIKNV